MKDEDVEKLMMKVAAGKRLTPKEKHWLEKINRVPRVEMARRKEAANLVEKSEADFISNFVLVIDRLPENLRRFEEFFSELPKVPVKVQKLFAYHDGPAFKAGQPHSVALAKYGLTLSDITASASALGALLNRAVRRGITNPPISIRIAEGFVTTKISESITESALEEEISQTLSGTWCPRDEDLAVKLVLRWLASVAFWEPKIILDWYAEKISENEIQLLKDPSNNSENWLKS